MHNTENSQGLLAPYRVLDLTDEKGILSGKLLGDLGADVIKIEPPGGDSARSLGPFFKDAPSPEKSLFWWAYNTNKRGITLNLDLPEGRRLFEDLVKTSDFVLESFDPGYLARYGLDYTRLKEINPAIIMVSITPFGQTGPYSGFKGPDIVTWAMSGRMYNIGDADRVPVRLSHIPQTYLMAGIEGAAAATMALYHRHRTGMGQHVDLSIQAAAAQCGDAAYDQNNVVRPRRTGILTGTRINVCRTWECKDGGLITWIYMPGSFDGTRRNAGLVKWMTEAGMASDFLKTFDWENLDYQTVTQDVIDALEAPTREFFLAHTKSELLAGAVKYRVLFYPQFTTADILSDRQLSERNFWEPVVYPEVETPLRHPGAFALFSETPIQIRRPAPEIGEHNREVYSSLLGCSPEEMTRLEQTGVI